MVRGASKSKSKSPRRRMTVEDIRAFNERLLARPEIQEMLREANDPANADDVVRWET